MLGLLEKNRSLFTAWRLTQPVNAIAVIAVEANALTLNTGYVSCTYEFEGWSAYLDAKKATQDNNY